jgi:hypothetical protein
MEPGAERENCEINGFRHPTTTKCRPRQLLNGLGLIGAGSIDTLSSLPFTRRLGPRTLRFSERGLETWQHQGREIARLHDDRGRPVDSARSPLGDSALSDGRAEEITKFDVVLNAEAPTAAG